MRIAKDNRGNNIWASSGIEGYCPYCKEKLIIKSGPLIQTHYSHLPKSKCKAATGEKSEWHLIWQSKFDNIEVKIGNNIADVLLSNGMVLEFQNSSISFHEIRKRESVYKTMFWLFNCIDKDIQTNGNKFTWKRPKISWLYYTKPAFFHVRNNLIAQFSEIDFSRDGGNYGHNETTMTGNYNGYTPEEWVNLCHTMDKEKLNNFHIRQHEEWRNLQQ